ncbi:MAG: hypothetical protein OXF09_01695 [Hyphomicrobiales bacterium]|nr:hypothetical protein [Hyphomicrobiales bacterium]
MPLKSERVLDIIKQQTEKVNNRCEGWNDEVFSLVADILNLERQHSVNRTHIETKILDQINITAQSLHQKRNNAGNEE